MRSQPDWQALAGKLARAAEVAHWHLPSVAYGDDALAQAIAAYHEAIAQGGGEPHG